jgi:hypothetical protein
MAALGRLPAALDTLAVLLKRVLRLEQRLEHIKKNP